MNNVWGRAKTWKPYTLNPVSGPFFASDRSQFGQDFQRWFWNSLAWWVGCSCRISDVLGSHCYCDCFVCTLLGNVGFTYWDLLYMEEESMNNAWGRGYCSNSHRGRGGTKCARKRPSSQVGEGRGHGSFSGHSAPFCDHWIRRNRGSPRKHWREHTHLIWLHCWTKCECWDIQHPWVSHTSFLLCSISVDHNDP